MIAGVVGLLAIWIGIPIITASVAIWQEWMSGAAASLGAVWFLYFGVMSFAISCPECGRSVFMRGLFVSVPWPAQKCSKCGRDLTVP